MKAEVPMISVIIPMYNAEKYIEQAIDSVLDQTFKDVEVIVINDCSTDGSLELVRSRYENNPRVRLLHNRINRGVAKTRNIGMRAANGKYIALLDADDAYLPNMLETLYNVAETHDADVVSTSGWLFSEGEEIARDFSGRFTKMPDGTPVDRLTILPTAELKMKLDAYIRGEFGFACCWNKIYRRDFLMQNDIFFPKHSEDRCFTFQCALHAQKYVKIPMLLNIYRNSSVSIISRRPPSFEALAKTPADMSNFAADFERIMDEIDFFKENPVYKYRIIDVQLNALDIHSVLRYYSSGRALNPNVIAAVCEKTPEAFGEHAPFVNWLFHRYHMYYRRCLELESKLK